MSRKEIIEFYANDSDSLAGDNNETTEEMTLAESSENLRSALNDAAGTAESAGTASAGETEKAVENTAPSRGYDPIEDADDEVNVEISARDESGNASPSSLKTEKSGSDETGVKNSKNGKKSKKTGDNSGAACGTRICSGQARGFPDCRYKSAFQLGGDQRHRRRPELQALQIRHVGREAPW